MRRPATATATAAAAALAVLVLMSLAVDGCAEQEKEEKARPSMAAIGGRKVLPRRALEDLKRGDPLRDSERRVPNGPDPIHNRSAGKSGRSPGRE